MLSYIFKGLASLVVSAWVLFASYAGAVWIEGRYVRPDHAALVLAVCNHPGTVVFVRADGELEFVQPGEDRAAFASILRRASLIRPGHKFIVRSTCPTPPMRG
jgi:hypothetical protein